MPIGAREEHSYTRTSASYTRTVIAAVAMAGNSTLLTRLSLFLFDLSLALFWLSHAYTPANPAIAAAIVFLYTLPQGCVLRILLEEQQQS